MPLATMIVIDSSDFMRNGDYSPSRIMAVQDATNILCESLMQRNPENVLGFLTSGGQQCAVRETLTDDVERVTGSLASIAVGGGNNFGHGIQIAMLALSHVKNTRSEKQVVVFCGSPILESQERLVQLAKALRKDDVGISVVSLGVPANTPLLNKFVDAVGRNAYLYVIPEGHAVLDVLFTTALMGGDGAGVPAMGSGAGGPPTALGQDADDPQMAMALRASLEEEQRRQAAAANSANAAGTSNQQPTGQDASAAGAAPPQEEDDLELALRLSMEQALREEREAQQQQQGGTSAAGAPSTSAGNAAAATTTTTAKDELAEFEAALQDPDVLGALDQIAKEDDANAGAKPSGGKPADDKKK